MIVPTYAEAAKRAAALLEAANDTRAGGRLERYYVAAGQAWATLALAAATHESKETP